ncbi:MAG: MarR family transcriptional regulator, partial [Planctomycetia bacterium]|nr:MarR family transcriptional regulator [Planctomycetia bacterium]
SYAGMSPALSTEEEIIVALRRITRAVDLWSHGLWQEFGLTSPQLAVLREVRAQHNVTPTSIAESLHLSQPTVTGILQRLQRAGLIRRQRSQNDRRSVVACVTPKGELLARKSPPLFRDRVRQRLADLSQPRRAALLADVQLLAEIMGAPKNGEGPFLYNPPLSTARASRQGRKRPRAANVRRRTA